MDCFVAKASRNDVDDDAPLKPSSLRSQGRRVDIPPHSRDTMRPSFASSFAPKTRGRREDRVRAAPAVSCANRHIKTRTRIQVQRRQSGLPCAMVLTVSFVLSPARPGLFVIVAPKKRELLKNLTPATGASRTTRLRRPRQPRSSVVALASTASHRALRDVRNAPRRVRQAR
jgi:hypothetical protein